MTEAEWLTAIVDEGTLTAIAEIIPLQKVSPRKWRLFATAGCRMRWTLLDDERSRSAVCVAERYADGKAKEGERLSAQDKAQLVHPSATDPQRRSAARGAVWTAYSSGTHAAMAIAAESDRRNVAQLLRDIVGNPFRPVIFNDAWRTSTTTNLATAIYEDRQLPSGLFDNQRLAVLADALEEAGCDNADILGHLRGGGDHVRGCWVVDLVLAKE